MAFAIVAALVALAADGRSPSSLATDTAKLAHCSVLPNRSDHRVHLIRQHADQPCRTYCRLATDTSDTAIAAEIVVAMDVELDVERMRQAVPSDVPRLHSHHIYSMHLCVCVY